jgi:hypothetical protein
MSAPSQSPSSQHAALLMQAEQQALNPLRQVVEQLFSRHVTPPRHSLSSQQPAEGMHLAGDGPQLFSPGGQAGAQDPLAQVEEQATSSTHVPPAVQSSTAAPVGTHLLEPAEQLAGEPPASVPGEPGAESVVASGVPGDVPSALPWSGVEASRRSPASPCRTGSERGDAQAATQTNQHQTSSADHRDAGRLFAPRRNVMS